MGNRIIKESICTSNSIDQLSWFEEVLFYRLLVNADDYGRLDGRLPVIKGRLFPLKDIRVEQIDDGLSKLSSVGIVARYQVKGQSFLQIVTWGNHQSIRNKKSKFPAPEYPLVDNSIENNCNQLHTFAVPIQSNPIQSNSIQSNPTNTTNVAINYYQEKIKPLKEKEMETLVLVVKAHGLEAFKNAVDKAKKAGGNSLGYIMAILDRAGDKNG